jgi:spore germination protein
MKKWKIVTIIFFIIFTSGCVEKEILDDINIITAAGFDLVEEDKIMGTALIPVYEEQTIANETFTEVSIVSNEVLTQLQKKSSDPLVSGGVEVVLFSDELAKRGIVDLVDQLLRDPSTGAKIYLAVVEGKAKDLLEGNFGNRGMGTYLSYLIENNQYRSDLPKNNLHVFRYNYFAKGTDPHLPLIKVEGDKVKIIGVALLRGDKMVDKLPEDQLFFFKLLTDKYSEGTYTVKVKKNEYASVESISSKRRIRVKNQHPYPEITVNIDIKGIIKEYSGEKISPKIINEIEAKFEKDIVKDCSELIKRFKELKVDPVGFGDEAKAVTRNFDYKKWYDQYPDIDIKVKANVNIVETGVTE